jgi:predicted small secreted protein
MKRIFALLLCAALLAGCGTAKGTAGSASSGAQMASSAAQTDSAPQAAAEPETVSGEPLSGTEKADATSWRPVGITVSNTPGAAAHQWGLADASVVIEALTEGKTTNLMLWYPSVNAVPKVGPVTQGKDIFWQFALPENSIVAQKGSNIYAENLLNCYGWQPLDAMYVGVNCFDFDGSDPAAANEDGWFTQGSTLQNGMAYYGTASDGTVPQWLHFSAQPEASGNAAASVKIAYSDQAATILNYTNNTWEMCHADGSAYLDANSGAQPAFQNVILLYCSAGVKDDHYTRDYDLTGGSGLYLVNGTWQTITWKKGDAASPLKLFAADGTELSVACGKTYLGVYGGFAGQSVTVSGADGAAIETGLSAPAAIPVPEPAAPSEAAGAASGAASQPAA